MRLYPDPYWSGRFVAYDNEGELVFSGYPDIDVSTGKVTYINELTPAVDNPDPADAPTGSLST